MKALMKLSSQPWDLINNPCAVTTEVLEIMTRSFEPPRCSLPLTKKSKAVSLQLLIALL